MTDFKTNVNELTTDIYKLLLYHLFGLAYDIRSVYIPIQNKI